MALRQDLLTIRPLAACHRQLGPPLPGLGREFGWVMESARHYSEVTRAWQAGVPVAALIGVLLASCGGGDGSHETVVAALGDSITAGSPLWDPNPAVRQGLARSDPDSQYERWAERRLNGVHFRNCGVFGQRTDQIAARLDECAMGADVLIVQGGINDIAQMRRARTAARNLRRMVQRGEELGLRVALVELLPWNNGYPFADHRIRRLNRAIHEIGREEGVPVLPWYRRLEDPRRPGRMKPEWTIDGNHPSVQGYRRLGEAMSSDAPDSLFK
jgi:lysophospholipase L1-like esterase